ncbi:hypothetical protein KHS38_05085 [Mucilaginibacter sp. Bleaf8]|uniref:hypothetical protein n=1 Tax=Mucilaginibacter sp. Bleaf8 TaxID=2834430 RepID=UPI001BCBF5B9|nr:hypothetical protein [Mucilaginibacter sp. Bleaf8]MBS7563770.1 hypothetical protein [Mucilaginibacter sp. Bleaf8]
MILKHYAYLLLGCLATATACNSSNDAGEQKAAASGKAAAKAPALMSPFRYHKAIEVAPGQYYDVMSWGRGTDSVGAFQILRSDSTEKKFTTTTGDLEGRIVDVLNLDMDTDGDPEIFIHTQVADTTHKAVVFGFEYNGDRARQLDFPKLTRSQRKGYRGNDSFFIKEGKLMREFNVYDEDDTTNAKPVQKRLIAYDLRGNSINGEQVSTDSTQTSSKKNDVQPVAAPKQEAKQESRSHASSNRRHTSSRKKTSSKRERTRHKETHTTKKKRRHR